MERKLTIVTVILAVCVNLYLAGLHKGYVLGMEAYSEFSFSHNPYDYLSMDYHRIVSCLIIFTFIKIFTKKRFVLSYLFCIGILIISIFSYKHLYLSKSFRFSEPILIGKVLEQSYILDWIGFGLFVLLFALQVYGISHYLVNKFKQSNDNNEANRI